MVAMAYSIDPTILKERAGCEWESLNLASHRENFPAMLGRRLPSGHGPPIEAIGRIHNNKGAGAQCRAMVDSGPLAEKPWLTERGWDSLAGIPALLPRVWLLGIPRTVVTTLALEPDAFQPRTCKQCGACLEACPTGAIIAPYVVRLSYAYRTLPKCGASFPMAFGSSGQPSLRL